MKHALIVGPRGVGKSTLIRRVVKTLDCPVFGFETKRETEMEDQELGFPIYIHKYGERHRYSKENLMGYCKRQKFNTITDAFNKYASNLMHPVLEGSLICFDELGFMEAQEKGFCDVVFEKLNEDIPVIAAVKDKDFPFLNEVREHPKCRCFYITKENREALFVEVLEFMKTSKGL